MTARVCSMVLGAWMAAAAAPVLAQAPGAPAAPTKSPSFFLSADGGYQMTTTTASSTVTYQLYAEDAVMEVEYETKAGPVFGARAGLRVWRRLTLGAGISVISQDVSAAVSAQLPHPFYFQKPRQVEGDASGLTRDETVLYAELGWQVPLGQKLDVALFAGPAFFKATQEVATKVGYSDSYPFDTATFSGVDSVSERVSATGFTLGADITYRLTRTVGVGGLIRYSKASADVEPVSGQPFTLNLGGLQTTVGLRLRF